MIAPPYVYCFCRAINKKGKYPRSVIYDNDPFIKNIWVCKTDITYYCGSRFAYSNFLSKSFSNSQRQFEIEDDIKDILE